MLAGATILTQIAHPLAQGRALTAVTLAVVVLFCLTTLTHAALTAGWSAAVALLLTAGGVGLLAEVLGTATGFPFGPYDYAGTLGPSLLSVPLVIPLAWTMMAWPALLAGRRLASAVAGRAGGRLDRALARRALTAVLGGLVLASWDLYLDPTMTAAGHWTFADPQPGLPGLPGIPLTNSAGWVMVSVVMTALLDRFLPRTGPGGRAIDERVPATLLGWTWLGSFVANLFFLGEPVVAGYGVVGMGLLVGPYLVLLLRGDRRRAGHAVP